LLVALLSKQGIQPINIGNEECTHEVFIAKTIGEMYNALLSEIKKKD